MRASHRSAIFITLTVTTVVSALSARADISDAACNQIRELSAKTNFPLFFELGGAFYSLQNQNLGQLRSHITNARGANVRFIYLGRNIDNPNADDPRPTLFAFKQRLSTDNSWNDVQTWNNKRRRAIRTEFATYQQFHRDGAEGS